MALFENILLSHMAKNLEKVMQVHKKPVSICYDKEGFKALVDVHQFKQGEVRARLEREKELIVEACHKEISDGHGLVSRRFSRRYVLPAHCDPAQLTCQVSSDGVLVISAPPKNDNPDTKPVETAVDSSANNKTEAIDETSKTDEVVNSNEGVVNSNEEVVNSNAEVVNSNEEVVNSNEEVVNSNEEVVNSNEEVPSSTEEAVISAEGPKTEELNGSADEVKTDQPNSPTDVKKTDKINGSLDHEKTEGMNGTSDGKTGEEDGPEDPTKSPVVKQADKKLKLEDGSVVSNGTTDVSAE